MALNIQEQKKILRKEIKTLKSQYSESEIITKSKDIFLQFEKLFGDYHYTNVLAYWSLADEVHTHRWVEQNYKLKTIFLPVVKNDELIVKTFTGKENMHAVPPFGIKEPMDEEFFDYNAIDIVLVPGMAFDRKGYRMGRGKGYYDKFLPNISAIRIGICFDFQLFDQIPINQYDVQMDYIVSNNEVITINKKAL